MSATSGPSLPPPFATYDPDSSSWRTCAVTSLWGSEPYSATWPKRGTTLDGCAYELAMLAPPTSEPGSSFLLPTPVSRDGKGRNTTCLPGAVDKLLPTPEASDATGGRQSKEMGGVRPSGAKRAVTLATAVHHKLLPTPTAGDAKSSGSRNLEGSKAHAGVSLTDAVRFGNSTTSRKSELLPTPQARDGDSRGADAARYKGPKSQGGRRSNLDDAVEAIRTKAPWLPSTGASTNQLSDDGRVSLDPHPSPSTTEADSTRSSSNG